MIPNKKYSVLKSIIVQKGMTQQEIAEAIGMDRTTFNIKINRYQGRDFTLQEAMQISNYIKEPIDNFF